MKIYLDVGAIDDFEAIIFVKYVIQITTLKKGKKLDMQVLNSHIILTTKKRNKLVKKSKQWKPEF